MQGFSKSCGCLKTETDANTLGRIRRADVVDGTRLSHLSKTPSSRNNSGVRGVCYHKGSGKWMVSIGFKKKKYYLGLYKDINDAIRARNLAENILWKPYLEDNIGEFSTEEERIELLHKYFSDSNNDSNE